MNPLPAFSASITSMIMIPRPLRIVSYAFLLCSLDCQWMGLSPRATCALFKKLCPVRERNGREREKIENSTRAFFSSAGGTLVGSVKKYECWLHRLSKKNKRDPTITHIKHIAIREKRLTPKAHFNKTILLSRITSFASFCENEVEHRYSISFRLYSSMHKPTSVGLWEKRGRYCPYHHLQQHFSSVIKRRKKSTMIKWH